MMSEISLRDYEIQMEAWKAMKQLEPGTRNQRPEDIAIINHQFLNVPVENSEVVVFKHDGAIMAGCNMGFQQLPLAQQCLRETDLIITTCVLLSFLYLFLSYPF